MSADDVGWRLISLFLLATGVATLVTLGAGVALARYRHTRPGAMVAGSRPGRALLSLLDSLVIRLLGLLGVEAVQQLGIRHSPAELRQLLAQARAAGSLEESDSAMLAGVFDLHAKKARDVMRPRTDVAAIPLEATLNEVREHVRRERYSRYPVYQETLDDVRGVFLASDLWLNYTEGDDFHLSRMMRDAQFVPESRSAALVLDDLRRTRAGIAVVLDEYGGTAGILTMEDLLEEVVGDIADEHDFVASGEAIESDGILELAGTISLVDARTEHSLGIPDGDWTTVGGYTFSSLGRIPHVGDRVGFPGGELEVVAMEGRRVAGVRVLRSGSGGAEGGAELGARA